MNTENQIENKTVVINSLGEAGTFLIPQLQKGFNIPGEIVAQKLYQAPSVLARDIPEDLAKNVIELLKPTGVEISMVDSGQNVECGDHNHEIALHFKSFKEMDSVYKVVREILGFSEAEFRTVIKKTPCVLVGSISKVTAEVFRNRLKGLPVIVEASDLSTAQFDTMIHVELDRTVTDKLERMRAQLRELDVAFSEERINTTTTMIMAQSISGHDAEKIWQFCEQNKIRCQLMNQVYHRFDLKLEAVPSNKNEVGAYLTSDLGIAEKVIDRVLESAPIVVGRHLSFNDVRRHMERLAEFGAVTQAELLATSSFQIELLSGENTQSAKLVLEQIFDLNEKGIQKLFEQLSEDGRALLPGSFGYNQALWGRAELEKLGFRSKLVQSHESK